MKIAVVAPVIHPIPPEKYGGIEAIVASLVRGAAEAGHSVVLYAPHGSAIDHPRVTVRATTDHSVFGHPEEVARAEQTLFQRLVAEQAEFDLIHSHLEPIIAATEQGNYLAQLTVPLTVTMHNQTYIDDNIAYYRSHPETHRTHFTFISHNQAKPLAFLPHQSVIYNGINLSQLAFRAEPEDQLVFMGRITPEKGISEAIEIAQRAGKPLVIAAAIDPTNQEYYDTQIKPRIDGTQIRYIGEIGQNEKRELLGSGAGLLFPIQWQEPFGLVMAEALACGTPVIATRIGSTSEIVDHGKTGFIIDQAHLVTEAAEAVAHLSQIDRQYCHDEAVRRFDEGVMVRAYLEHYEALVRGR